MSTWLRATAMATALLASIAGSPAHAQLPSTIRIGVLNDMSGPYADVSGKGTVIAAQMASEDFLRRAPALRR